MQINNAIALLAAGSALLLVDQWSKEIVQARAADRAISLAPLLQIRHVAHVQGIYRRTSSRAVLVLAWFAALGCSIILHRSGVWFQSQAALYGLTLALAGAAGNLLDILRWSHVVDFIDLRWWP